MVGVAFLACCGDCGYQIVAIVVVFGDLIAKSGADYLTVFVAELYGELAAVGDACEKSGGVVELQLGAFCIKHSIRLAFSVEECDGSSRIGYGNESVVQRCGAEFI